MSRLLTVLFWICLIVGTYVTGNVVGNWAVCLLALALFARSRSVRRRDPQVDAPASRRATGSRPGEAPLAMPARQSLQPEPEVLPRRWR